MATVFRKHSRHRKGNRRSKNWHLSMTGESTCENCKKSRPPHTVCPHCGFYAGKLIIAKKVKKSKKKPQQGEGADEKES